MSSSLISALCILHPLHHRPDLSRLHHQFLLEQWHRQPVLIVVVDRAVLQAYVRQKLKHPVGKTPTFVLIRTKSCIVRHWK
jgi:hypothetical protein